MAAPVSLSLLIAMSHPGPDDEFVQAVALACLQRGLVWANNGYQLMPVPCDVIGTELKENCGGFTGKLLSNLRDADSQRYFRVIEGPLGTQPAVLARLSPLIAKPHSPEIRKILKEVEVVDVHPSFITWL